jgi:hypothetical protein
MLGAVVRWDMSKPAERQRADRVRYHILGMSGPLGGRQARVDWQ